MMKIERWGAFVAASLWAAGAMADYELYDANDTKLDLQLTSSARSSVRTHRGSASSTVS